MRVKMNPILSEIKIAFYQGGRLVKKLFKLLKVKPVA
jgi:hypothetical protein